MRKRGELLATFIISFSDGLILPVVLITALSHLAYDNIHLVKITLLISTLYAIVMGISNYFTRRTHNRTDIKTETFKNIGLSKVLEKQLLQDHEQEKQEWEEVLKENETAEEKSETAALSATLAYILSGLVLLLPYWFSSMTDAFKMSCILCGLLMIVFGTLKAKVTGNAPFRVIARSLFYAGILSAMAYWMVGVFTA